jgi:hypothetical protein
MAKRLGLHSDEAYARRHEDRQLWYEYLNEFRRDDPSKLIQLVLQTSDIVCGVRDREEMFAARREGLVDLLVWVHRPQAPLDTTVTYSRSDCDIVIDNDGTIPQFHTRIRNLAKALGLLTEPGWNTSEEAI